MISSNGEQEKITKTIKFSLVFIDNCKEKKDRHTDNNTFTGDENRAVAQTDFQPLTMTKILTSDEKRCIITHYVKEERVCLIRMCHRCNYGG